MNVWMRQKVRMTVWMREKKFEWLFEWEKNFWMSVWMKWKKIPNKKHYTGQHSHSPKTHTHKKRKRVCMEVWWKWVCVNDYLCGWVECTPRMTSVLERMREWMKKKKKMVQCWTYSGVVLGLSLWMCCHECLIYKWSFVDGDGWCSYWVCVWSCGGFMVWLCWVWVWWCGDFMVLWCGVWVWWCGDFMVLWCGVWTLLGDWLNNS